MQTILDPTNDTLDSLKVGHLITYNGQEKSFFKAFGETLLFEDGTWCLWSEVTSVTVDSGVTPSQVMRVVQNLKRIYEIADDNRDWGDRRDEFDAIFKCTKTCLESLEEQ